MPRQPFIVFGTRPEAIKLAPVVREFRRAAPHLDPLVCSTGQHREMLAQVTDYFDIRIDVNLDVMRPNQTLAGLTSRLIEGLDYAFERSNPLCVIAQGDTTTVMAASLAAFYRQIPFVHVEAGLRTGNLNSPWPEELNRRIAGLSAALHCAPTQQAAENLRREGVDRRTIAVTGNTVIDALLHTVERERHHAERWLDKYRFLAERRVVLITGHRRENFGHGMQSICSAIVALAKRFADVEFVYPVHLNPNVATPVRELLSDKCNVHLIAPVPYPEFIWLMDRSTLILSDSGGVQEEAPSLKKPVLVMRDTTERPEAVEVGAVELVGTSCERIVDRATVLLTVPQEYAKHQAASNPYGDGRSAGRIVRLLAAQTWFNEVSRRAG